MLAIIGGSGLESLSSLVGVQTQDVDTPFGVALLKLGNLSGKPVIFLPRHGPNHHLAPHLVNYRANCWALKQAGVTSVLACNVVGGISECSAPGTLVLPRQIIDYTWGRQHTFYDGCSYPDLPLLDHIDFCEPITPVLLDLVQTKLTACNVTFVSDAVYGCTQGPRLESAAEITRFKIDGCDIVGMTAMPEASLARELGLQYVMLSYVVNWAAGVIDGVPIKGSEAKKFDGTGAYAELSLDEIITNVKCGAKKVNTILEKLVVTLNI